MEGGKESIPDDLKPLIKTIATIYISTSECDRNVNSMKEIITYL